MGIIVHVFTHHSVYHMSIVNFIHAFVYAEMSGETLESLISYLYCGKLQLRPDSAVLLLAGATQLGIQSAVELCRHYLSSPPDQIVKCDDDDKTDNNDDDDDILSQVL